MIKPFFTIFLPSIILVGGIITIFYISYTGIEKKILKKNEAHIVEIQTEMIVKTFESIVSDLMFLSEHHVLQKMLTTGALEDQQIVAEEYLSFSMKKKIYDQIRFLNNHGMEIVRVNFNNGHPHIVPKQKLQSKAQRYYFREISQQKYGRIFVSPFDLNIEEEKIEQPLKPVIRFGTPVVDKDGQKRGMVILNYLGLEVFQRLKKLSANTSGQFIFLNAEGYWLKGLKQEDEWGFMYENKITQTFQNSFSQAGYHVFSRETGQFYTSKGLFTFNTIYPPARCQTSIAKFEIPPDSPSSSPKNNYWKILSYVPSNVLDAKPSQLFSELLILYAILAGLLTLISWYLANVQSHRSKEITERKQAEERLKASLQEKEVLIQEIHHRVKNNLQVISSLLKLQSRYAKDEDTLTIFQESQNRIQAMSAIHEILYQSNNLASIPSKEYIETLVKNLSVSYGLRSEEIALTIDVQNIPLRIDDAISCGLIINELISNSIKHAFPERKEGTIEITLKLLNKTVQLVVEDNGIGIPENLNIANSKSMGLRLIHFMVEELQGTLLLDRTRGTQFQIQFMPIQTKEHTKDI